MTVTITDVYSVTVAAGKEKNVWLRIWSFAASSMKQENIAEKTELLQRLQDEYDLC